RDAKTVAALLSALRGRPGDETRPSLEAVIRDRKQTTANRLLASTLFFEGLNATSEGRLVKVAEATEDGLVLADLLRATGTRKVRVAGKLLFGKLSSSDAEVRAAALGAIAELAVPDALEPVRKRLDDPDIRVRSAAALAAGKLRIRNAGDQLLKLARDPE